MPRHGMRGNELLECASPRLGTDAVVIAAVAGNSDRTYNLTVHDERDATFDRHRSRQTQDAQP